MPLVRVEDDTQLDVNTLLLLVFTWSAVRNPSVAFEVERLVHLAAADVDDAQITTKGLGVRYEFKGGGPINVDTTSGGSSPPAVRQLFQVFSNAVGDKAPEKWLGLDYPRDEDGFHTQLCGFGVALETRYAAKALMQKLATLGIDRDFFGYRYLGEFLITREEITKG